MTALWTAEELVAGSQGKMMGLDNQKWSANGLSIDSRDIQQGDLFVALKAARDGHEFVAGALEKGAAGALVSHIPEGCEHANLLVVDDVEEALAQMGQYRRGQVDGKIVAVTGSVGKTSTKEMLLTALSSYGKTHASVKSFNNHWGVPLTLARMPRDTDYGIFEIGMNHPGEIEPLVKQVQPDVAVITNIAPVHLEAFENEEGIAREKASILNGLGAMGVGIINGDMKHRDLVTQFASVELKFFGENSNNDIIALDVMLGESSAAARIQRGASEYSLHLPTSGGHNVFNALAVVGVLEAFGLDPEQGVSALRAWNAPKGRGQKFTISSELGQIVLVDESYNANPLSMRAAIDAFALMPAKRHVAILGDMLELGENSADFHRELAMEPTVQSLDLVHAIGNEMHVFYDQLEGNKGLYFDDYNQIIASLEDWIQDGDAILVKGSLATGLGRVVDHLREFGQSKEKLN